MTHLIDLYRQAEDYFFRGISAECLTLGDRAVAYMTGLPLADLNPCYITTNPSDFGHLMATAHTFYTERRIPFVVIIPEAFHDSKKEQALKALGYSQTETSLAMGLDLRKSPAHTPLFCDQSIIHLMNDQLREWSLPLVSAFQSTEELTTRYTATHKQALSLHKNLDHFSLYVQGAPRASITLSYHNHLARIDDVGTVPEFQGKGHATRLLQHVLDKAKQLGAHYCFLEASEKGMGLYHKIGFKPLFKNYIFSPV